MVNLGRSKYSVKAGVYFPLIVAENMGLKDGDLVDFSMETSLYQVSPQDLIVRRSLAQDPFNPRPLEERRPVGR